jgi:hypothetical protein
MYVLSPYNWRGMAARVCVLCRNPSERMVDYRLVGLEGPVVLPCTQWRIIGVSVGCCNRSVCYACNQENCVFKTRRTRKDDPVMPEIPSDFGQTDLNAKLQRAWTTCNVCNYLDYLDLLPGMYVHLTSDRSCDDRRREIDQYYKTLYKGGDFEETVVTKFKTRVQNIYYSIPAGTTDGKNAQYDSDDIIMDWIGLIHPEDLKHAIEEMLYCRYREPYSNSGECCFCGHDDVDMWCKHSSEKKAHKVCARQWHMLHVHNGLMPRCCPNCTACTSFVSYSQFEGLPESDQIEFKIKDMDRPPGWNAKQDIGCQFAVGVKTSIELSIDRQNHATLNKLSSKRGSVVGVLMKRYIHGRFGVDMDDITVDDGIARFPVPDTSGGLESMDAGAQMGQGDPEDSPADIDLTGLTSESEEDTEFIDVSGTPSEGASAVKTEPAATPPPKAPTPTRSPRRSPAPPSSSSTGGYSSESESEEADAPEPTPSTQPVPVNASFAAYVIGCTRRDLIEWATYGDD